MIPELGFLILLMAAFTALVFSFISYEKTSYRASKLVSFGLMLMCWTSFAALVTSFMVDDFTVRYVWQNSNTTLPTVYKLTASWGAHEGSLLLWLCILSAWSFAYCASLKTFTTDKLTSLKIQWSVIFLMGVFIALLSNPFVRQFFPTERAGLDLNPLLQDLAFIIHPPMLYMGYVGLAIPFSIALASISHAIEPRTVIQSLAGWTMRAASFLTMGIMLGSWWAYYELGWGGWWFWDPVENAALIPWLNTIALVHISKVARVHPQYQKATFVLATSGFILSLLGTFLVRSGVVSSVHSFASDPTRGIALLAGVLLATVFTAWVFNRNEHLFKPSSDFRPRSTRMSVYQSFNGVLVICSLLIVLLGTLYPMFIEAFSSSSISIGAPYFNRTVIPIWFTMIIMLLVYQVDYSRLSTFHKGLMGAAMLLSAMLAGFYHTLDIAWPGILGAALVISLIAGSTRKKIASGLAHFGAVLLFVGISLNTMLTIEREASIVPGEMLTVGKWHFTLIEEHEIETEHSKRQIVDFVVQSDNGRPFLMSPEKQLFKTREMVMSETSISPGFFSDLYIALGDKRPNGAWTGRFYIKPFVRWIWMGGVFMSMGLLLGSRRRKEK